MLERFTYENMAKYVDTINSTTSYLYTFSSAPVSWVSRLKKVASLSTTKLEYLATTEDFKEMLWIQWFLSNIGIKQDKYVLYYDIQSIIHLGRNRTFHSRTKHIIHLGYHWTWQFLVDGISIRKIFLHVIILLICLPRYCQKTSMHYVKTWYALE